MMVSIQRYKDIETRTATKFSLRMSPLCSTSSRWCDVSLQCPVISCLTVAHCAAAPLLLRCLHQPRSQPTFPPSHNDVLAVCCYSLLHPANTVHDLGHLLSAITLRNGKREHPWPWVDILIFPNAQIRIDEKPKITGCRMSPVGKNGFIGQNIHP